MKKLLFIALLAVVPIAHGQAANPSIVLVSTAPSGSCGNGLPDQQVLSTGLIYSCQAGTWAQIGTGGSVGSAVTFNNSGTGGASGSTFNGSAPVTVSYNTIGASGPPTVSATGGDLACAVANDLTIGQKTITGGSSTASTITVSGASGFNNGYYVGEVINVQGVTPSGYNATSQVVASLTSNTTITYTNSGNPGAWVSGGTVSKTCGNLTNDAIAATPYTFANKFTVPANFMAAGLNVDAQAQMLFYVPTANPAGVTSIKLAYGATTVYQNLNPLVMATNAAPTNPYGGMMSWSLTGMNTTTAANNLRSSTIPTTSTPNFVSNANTVQVPATGLTTSATTLGPAIVYAATGVASGLTYVSGGTISGSQTCTLGTFNNSCSGTTANIVITSGTPGAITITARGAACTAAPTTATIAGTNCTGTVTLSGGVLGGSPGNAVELLTFAVKQN